MRREHDWYEGSYIVGENFNFASLPRIKAVRGQKKSIKLDGKSYGLRLGCCKT